jgi:hypothetical protein
MENSEFDDESVDAQVRDRPLSFHWKIDPAALTGLVPFSGDPGRDRALNSILTEAVLAYEDSEGWVSYSRRKAFYTGQCRYAGTSFTYSSVLTAVEQALAPGLIEEERALPGDHLRTQRQSRFRATPDLIRALHDVPIEYDVHETIRLRDDQKKLVGYVDSDDTRRMRRQMDRVNDFLSGIGVELTGPEVTYTPRHIKIDREGRKSQLIRLSRPVLHRVFSRGSFELNGRLYGGYWQNIPKSLRPNILINGESVVEPDFSQMHPAMLYAERGLKLEQDAYEIPGFLRSDAKLAFNIGLNARTTQGAILALSEAMGDTRKYASQVLKAVKARHAEVADAFGSDMGVRLMRADSEITLDVMNSCIEHDIPCLPIHDSVLVPKRHRETVMELMSRSFSRRYPNGSPCEVRG